VNRLRRRTYRVRIVVIAFAVQMGLRVTAYSRQRIVQPMLEPHHDRIAVIADDSGATVTYRELEARSNQCAHYVRGLGMCGGEDVVAVLLDNDVHYYDLLVGVRRSGATFTALNYDLDPDSLSHILAVSRAKVLVATDTMADLAARIVNATSAPPPHCLIVASSDRIPLVPSGFRRYDEVIGAASAEPLPDPSIGGFLNFTSGSSGMPKPIHYGGGRLPEIAAIPSWAVQALVGDERSVYLVPSPLYHTLPGLVSTLVHQSGGTVVLLRDFTPERVLETIERHRVTHSMMPPSLLTALSKLPDDIKRRFDVSSLRGVLHDAAPCAPVIKRMMLDWWGPILNEFYGASDVKGFTFITGADWLQHPGSVGTPLMCSVEVLDAQGNPLPVGSIGDIWFGQPGPGAGVDIADVSADWRNSGDLGYRDADGYLFHVDRRSNVVTINGRTYYPEQIEHILIGHPGVADVAVIADTSGLPATLTAVIQPQPTTPGSTDLAAELLDYYAGQARDDVAPVVIRFTERLPRAGTGKLYRQRIRLDSHT
jgi:long-chain acyl-CoA synthetase